MGESKMWEGYVLFANFVKDEPAIVSAAAISRILNDSPFGFVQALGAKWVVFGQGAKLAQELVRADIVGPSTGHRFRRLGWTGSLEDLLNPAELSQCVDFVSLERANQLSRLSLGKKPVSQNFCFLPQ